MLCFLSHRRLPSAAFPTDPAALRALPPFNKTARIAATQCTLNPSPNRDPQSLHRRHIVCASPTHLATILIRPLAEIQCP